MFQFLVMAAYCPHMGRKKAKAKSCDFKPCPFIPGGKFKQTGHCGHHQNLTSDSGRPGTATRAELRGYKFEDLVEWSSDACEEALAEGLQEFLSIVDLRLPDSVHFKLSASRQPSVKGGSFTVNKMVTKLPPFPGRFRKRKNEMQADAIERHNAAILKYQAAQAALEEEGCQTQGYEIHMRSYADQDANSLKADLFHELMHAVDYVPNNDPMRIGEYASTTESSYTELLDTCRATGSINEVYGSGMSRSHMMEVMSDEEIWARVASQWMLGELTGEFEPERDETIICHDFTYEEMEELAPLVEEVLSNHNLLH